MKLTSMAVLALSLTPALALAEANQTNVINKNGNSVMFLSKDDLAKTKNYWTEDRLNKATPKESPEITEQEIEKMKKEKTPLVNPKIIAKPFSPKNALHTPAKADSPTEADVNEYPFSTAGKLYFTEGDGSEHSCSAQFVASNVLLTAAHCVRDKETGEYYTNFKFHQGYRKGEEKDKIYGVSAATRSSWVVGGGEDTNRKVDYGFIITETESQLGWLGVEIGFNYDDFYAIGYPSNYSDGKVLQQVNGHNAGVEDGVAAMSNNPYGSGASGGAWIVDKEDGGYAIGNNASHKHDDPNTDYGPYYDSKFESLYDEVASEAAKLRIKK